MWDFVLYVICSLLHILFVLGLLLSVAYFTLLERKVMASVQRRVGPNVVGFYGILQPLVDGVKLLNKEIIVPQRANRVLFVLAPVLSFILALLLWALVPFSLSAIISDVDLGLLAFFFLSSLNVYGLIVSGWASNSKYAFLGALRSGAQVISYELIFGFIVVSVGLLSGSYNFVHIVGSQHTTFWYVGALFPLFVVFLIVMLAETNRAPFDLAEAEAEIVAGYNIEYSSIVFAMFFLAEYSNMLVMSAVVVLLFFGGFGSPLFVGGTLLCPLAMIVKISFFLVFFIITRAALPRYRYDQLMALGWKVLLPFSFAYFVFLSSVVALANLPVVGAAMGYCDIVQCAPWELYIMGYTGGCNSMVEC